MVGSFQTNQFGGKYREMETLTSEMQPKGYTEVGWSPRICRSAICHVQVVHLMSFWCALFYLNGKTAGVIHFTLQPYFGRTVC